MEKNTSAVTAFGRFVLLTAVAAAMVALFSRVLRINHTTVALAFLTFVLITAYRWRLAYSVYASILCTLLYNFYFLPPLGRLTISDPQNWVAIVAFLVASFLVSHLSDRERKQAEASEARRRDIELLYRFSQRLLVQDEVKELARSAPSILASVFGFRAVALYVTSADTVFYSDPAQILVSASELRELSGADHSIIQPRNGYNIIELRMGAQHQLGRMAITEDNTTLAMLEAIGSMVSVALERAATLERSSRLEAARESERLRSALVDSVTHDLRTPLTSIRAAATTLLNQPNLPEAERNDLVAVVEEESSRLDRLIGLAVEMARLDSHSVKVQLEAQDVGELIDMTVEHMQRELRDHKVKTEIPEDTPRVRMDRTLMQRVLQHLLENAARYSPAGSAIEVSARAENGRLYFSVADHGPGIAPEDLPFVFDKYFRGKRQATAKRGTGMGLAICQAILRAHQGEISAESVPEKGTRFTFWIPMST
jgi:two-component system sensor histidine kinase KdpD